MFQNDPLYKMGPAYLKSEGSKAYKRKDYVSAVNFYSMVYFILSSFTILLIYHCLNYFS